MKLLICALVPCTLWTVRATECCAGDAELQKLQGKWNVESFEFDGQPVDSMQRAVREFNGDQYTLTSTSGEIYSGAVKIDATQTPRHIDLELNGRTLKGIYEIDGDTLKLSYRLEGDQRPTEFVSKPDSGVALAIHKRAP